MHDEATGHIDSFIHSSWSISHDLLDVLLVQKCGAGRLTIEIHSIRFSQSVSRRPDGAAYHKSTSCLYGAAYRIM